MRNFGIESKVIVNTVPLLKGKTIEKGKFMKPGKGRLVAHLADSNEQLPTGIVELINNRIMPPEQVSIKDVYVRAMYVVSDQVNSFGGRFPVCEHEHLVSLLIDSPVLIGHRKDRLPVARTFHAETTERDGQAWVKSYFYWLKDADDALKLKENIDGGIIKECSISFTFLLPECSVCGRDIRLCQHEPLQKISGIEEELICHFNYRKIEKVLETSLVFRGAVPGTTLTKELGISSSGGDVISDLEVISNLSHFGEGAQYLVVPHYEGILLNVKLQENQLQVSRLNGKSIPADFLAHVNTAELMQIPNIENRPARLVGYRGKRRCSIAELEQFLKERTGAVSRLVLYLYPSADEKNEFAKSERGDFEIRFIPHRVSNPATIDSLGREIMTREGVEIWPLPIVQSLSNGFRYHPCPPSKKITKQEIMSFDRSRNVTLIRLNQGKPDSELVIQNYDEELFQQGRTFVSDLTLSATNDSDRFMNLADGVEMSKHGSGYHLLINNGDEIVRRSFHIRLIRINGKDKFLIKRDNAANDNI